MFEAILSELEGRAQLVAVSKTHPAAMIMELYQQGQRIFGENRIQELTEKYEALPKDIKWHMIGHLQTNKVKYIAPFIDLIHSVDSPRILKEINKQAKRQERTIKCLLQFKIAEEDSKYGLTLEEGKALLSSTDFQQMEHAQICGVMGMATFTDDKEQVKQEFLRLKHIFTTLKNDFFIEKADFKEISMGMSGDYQLALETGSTMVRIGSLIFGQRHY